MIGLFHYEQRKTKRTSSKPASRWVSRKLRP